MINHVFKVKEGCYDISIILDPSLQINIGSLLTNTKSGFKNLENPISCFALDTPGYHGLYAILQIKLTGGRLLRLKSS